MLLFRVLMLILLLTSGVSIAWFLWTGQERYKRFGVRTLKWTVLAGFCFFAILILERMV